MKENWAKQLKEQMDGFELPVDEGCWGRIAENAFPTAAVSTRPLGAIVCLALVCITAVLIIVLHYDKAVVPEEMQDYSAIAPTTPSQEVMAPIPSPMNSPEHRGWAPQGLLQEKQVTSEDYPKDNAWVTVTPLEEKTIKDNSAQPEIVQAVDEQAIICYDTNNYRRLCVSTSLFARASPFGNRYSESHGSVKNPVLQPEAASDSQPEGSNPDNTEHSSPISVGENKEDESTPAPEWTHAYPIQVGARVSFSWGECWSLESGLTFTRCVSRNTGKEIQRMDYLGVPINLIYSIKNYRQLTVYASAGAQAFKCFAGNSPDKPWLFAVGLGAGLEYGLAPAISLYAEPGATCYFHTGESRNYYTANPFALSVSVGLRFHFQ